MIEVENVLLRGVVGSTAYGLNRKGSDVDRLGVFVAPTLEVAGLNWHPKRESRVGKTDDGDATFHEVGKFLRLALKCNPTITELLWLPGPLIEVMHPFYGTRLIAIREALLSEGYVRDAYGGYARQQAEKLRRHALLSNKMDAYFSSDTRNRTTKHARHLLRLLRQGRQLLETGSLTVTVNDPEVYWSFDTMTPEQMLKVYDAEDKLFQATKSVLPEKPNRSKVEAYLSLVREAYFRE